jgi:hypothetical protein
MNLVKFMNTCMQHAPNNQCRCVCRFDYMRMHAKQQEETIYLNTLRGANLDR